jgi:hypothetical protein
MDFPDIFADKKKIESRPLKIERKEPTVNSESKPKPRSKSTGSRELNSLLLYSPEEIVETGDDIDTAAKITLSPVISNLRQTTAIELAATTRSGLVSVSDCNGDRNITTNDKNGNSNNGSDTRRRSVSSTSSINDESDNDDEHNSKNGSIEKSRNTRSKSNANLGVNNEKYKNNDHDNGNGSAHKSGNGRSLKVLTSSKSEEFSSKIPKNVLQIISG